jgi:hypothetical protein
VLSLTLTLLLISQSCSSLGDAGHPTSHPIS